jgi:SAM-dependent methyltransferase
VAVTLLELPAEPASTPRPPHSLPEFSELQALTLDLAFDPEGWTPERLARIGELFDRLAPEWHTRGGPERLRPLRDALRRGGVPAGGLCLEIGSGVGLQTPSLLEHFDSVVSMDLSAGMLRLASRAAAVQAAAVPLLRADASRLPIATASVDVVAVVNMFLFPAEYARVLRPGGGIVFVSTSGAETPIYLPPADVARALEPGVSSAHAVTAAAGWGCWTVLRKEAS